MNTNLFYLFSSITSFLGVIYCINKINKIKQDSTKEFKENYQKESKELVFKIMLGFRRDAPDIVNDISKIGRKAKEWFDLNDSINHYQKENNCEIDIILTRFCQIESEFNISSKFEKTKNEELNNLLKKYNLLQFD